jgi:hypothetical protein
MGSDDVSAAAWFRIARWMLVVTAAASGLGAAAAATIYSCVDSAGKRLTSDRPIVECTAREQRLLNADGSTKKVLPPTMTAEERVDAEAREREKAARRAAEVDAVRRDRNLRMRYPNEAAHQKARLAALDDLKRTLQLSERRLEALAAEKKPLLEEAEFYVGRAMPTGLKQQLDGVDATAEAQRALIQNQQAESQRINATFDAELARLRKLWAGAPPGSLGSTLPTPVAASAAPATLSPASASAAP